MLCSTPKTFFFNKPNQAFLFFFSQDGNASESISIWKESYLESAHKRLTTSATVVWKAE